MIMRQYDNKNNGGRERVYRDGSNYYVSSDWGDGFTKKQKVTLKQVKMCMRHTNAPSDVVAEILDEVTV